MIIKCTGVSFVWGLFNSYRNQFSVLRWWVI